MINKGIYPSRQNVNSLIEETIRDIMDVKNSVAFERSLYKKIPDHDIYADEVLNRAEIDLSSAIYYLRRSIEALYR